MLIEDFVCIKSARCLDFSFIRDDSLCFTIRDVFSHYLWLKDRQPPVRVWKSAELLSEVVDYLLTLYNDRAIPTNPKSLLVR